MEYQDKLKANINLFVQCTKPATLAEIETIEQNKGIIIPPSLKEFFLLVGNEYDCLWGGGGMHRLSTLTYHENLSKNLLKECNINLNMNFFVFSSYSDDQFMFVYLDKNDNPDVYRFETELYYCGDDYIPNSSTWDYPRGVSKVAESFSSMINEIVENRIKSV